jgi:long-chain acyl-CoA synthetase
VLFLQIIDRKKDLVKLQQGEYVALSKVEGVIKLFGMIDNAMVHVNSSKNFCTALICPNFRELERFCASKGLTSNLDEAIKHPDVIAEYLRGIREISKGKLTNFEIPERVALIPAAQAWTPENDLLTAAMKLKRKPIINAHAADLDALYAN